jgi:hypothetical protein
MGLVISAILFAICMAKKKSKVVFIITGIWVWVLMAFSSGLADEGIYIGRYQNYKAFTGMTEPGYTLLMEGFNRLGVPYDIYKIFITAFELVLILSTIACLTEFKNFVLALYMVFPLCMDAVQMRFTLGLSFTIFGFRFLSDKYVDEHKKHRVPADICYVICILIATMFHSINVLYLILLVAKKVKRKNIIIVVIAAILLFTVVLNRTELIHIGTVIGVGSKINDALANTTNMSGHAVLHYATEMIIRFALFITVYLIAHYGVHKKNRGMLSDDCGVNANIMVLSIIALLQYSIEFYRIQVGLSIFNYIFLSGYLVNTTKKSGKFVMNKSNVAVCLSAVIMAVINLYNLVLNNTNINTVFTPFFFNNSLLGG